MAADTNKVHHQYVLFSSADILFSEKRQKVQEWERRANVVSFCIDAIPTSAAS
jgi:hypothetical protein